ncbi:MAG: hypothetical protein ACK5RE_06685 [Pseudanabaena sp.]
MENSPNSLIFNIILYKLCAIAPQLNLNNLRSPQTQSIKKRSPLNSISTTRDRLKPNPSKSDRPSSQSQQPAIA